MFSTVVSLFSALTVFFVTILGLEYAAIAFLSKNNIKVSPPLYRVSEFRGIDAMQQSWGDEQTITLIDPALGYARAHLDGTFNNKEFRSYEVLGQGPYKIMVLGGSTTSSHTSTYLDPSVRLNSEAYSWPRELVSIIGSDKVTIFNGAVAGYYSSIELIKIVRDIHFLKPNLVIALNGVNEPSGLHAQPGYQLLSKYENKLFKQVMQLQEPNVLPNIVKAIRLVLSVKPIQGVELGPEHGIIDHQRWANNIDMSKAVVRGSGADYQVFLQPILGAGKRRASEKEKKLEAQLSEKYIGLVKDFYKNASIKCDELDYCVNLTSVFDNEVDVYIDARHQNRKGTRNLAHAIFHAIEGRIEFPVSETPME